MTRIDKLDLVIRVEEKTRTAEIKECSLWRDTKDYSTLREVDLVLRALNEKKEENEKLDSRKKNKREKEKERAKRFFNIISISERRSFIKGRRIQIRKPQQVQSSALSFPTFHTLAPSLSLLAFPSTKEGHAEGKEEISGRRQSSGDSSEEREGED